MASEENTKETTADEGSTSKGIETEDSEEGIDDVEFKLMGFEEEDDPEATEAASDSPALYEDSESCWTDASPKMKHHALVPRNRDLAEVYQNTNKDKPPTTMMIRNIPGRYSQNEFLKELNAMGFASTFDFLYLPMDRASSANVGYAFVNFTDAQWATKCQEMFDGYRFKRYQRSVNSKVTKVSVAHLQGLEANLQHYKKTAVNMAKERRRRPTVMANIATTLE